MTDTEGPPAAPPITDEIAAQIAADLQDRQAKAHEWEQAHKTGQLGPDKPVTFNPEAIWAPTGPKPEPLITTPPAPPFPMDSLPPAAASYVTNVAEATQTPTDLAATCALGTLATLAMWNNATIDLDTWTEPGNLYLVCVLGTGEGKSPTMKWMCEPIHTMAGRMVTDNAALLSRQIALRKQAQARHKQAERALDKNPDDPDTLVDEQATRDALDLIPEQGTPTYILDDVTPEAMIEAIRDNGGHLTVLSSEPGIFDQTSRYQQAGTPPNIELMLKAWSGEGVNLRRVGRGVTTLDSPSINMMLMAQPVAISRIYGNTEMRERGLAPRLMMCHPATLVGHRQTINRPTIQNNLKEAWEALCQDVNIRMGAHPTTILTPGIDLARFVWDEWRKNLETRIGSTGDLHHIAGFMAKIISSTARTCLLLHHAWGHTGPIEPDTMHRAIQLGDYWIGHLCSEIAATGTDQPDRRAAQAVLNWAARHDMDSFTIRELRQAGVLNRTHGRTVTDISPVIRVLLDTEWVTVDQDDWDRPKRGVVSATLTVSPWNRPSGRPESAQMATEPAPQPDPEEDPGSLSDLL